MIYYKAHMSPAEGEFLIEFREFHQIHESKCFSFCVDMSRGSGRRLDALKLPSETKIQAAKRIGCKVRRIHKEYSRIAFKTKEDAYKNMLFLKQRQLRHIQRDFAIITEFMKLAEGVDFHSLASPSEQYWRGQDLCRKIDDVNGVISEHYVFD